MSKRRLRRPEPLSRARPDGVILTHLTVRRRFHRRRIRHGGDLQGGVICRRCNAKSENLAGGELRGGEIGAVILSAEISEAVKCGAPHKTRVNDLSCDGTRFFRFVTNHAFDRQTDGQTAFSWLQCMQRAKNRPY